MTPVNSCRHWIGAASLVYDGLVQLPEREAALSLLSRLAQVGLGAQLVLAGSSGLFAASATLPALTEDLDSLVDAEWLAEQEPALLAALRGLGFEHHAGTCTFTDAQGSSLDLVGYSLSAPGDRIGGGATVPAMVYGDLGLVMSDADAVVELPGGGCALSPAALATVKLLTVRVEKGGKDKLQALLLIDETGRAATLRDVTDAPLGALSSRSSRRRPGRRAGRVSRPLVGRAAGRRTVARLRVAGPGCRPWPGAAHGLAGLARVSRALVTTQERWRRAQRDLETYRRRHLWRRTWPRFQGDLTIVPHLFLTHEDARFGRLLPARETALEALRGRAVWTLDTAARLACGRGLLHGRDLTGYLSAETLEDAERQRLVEPMRATSLSLEPLAERPPLLIAHVTGAPPPLVDLADGQRVVSWDFLLRDVLGTLGWRPDLLTRLDGDYPRA